MAYIVQSLKNHSTFPLFPALKRVAQSAVVTLASLNRMRVACNACQAGKEGKLIRALSLTTAQLLIHCHPRRQNLTNRWPKLKQTYTTLLYSSATHDKPFLHSNVSWRPSLKVIPTTSGDYNVIALISALWTTGLSSIQILTAFAFF